MAFRDFGRDLNSAFDAVGEGAEEESRQSRRWGSHHFTDLLHRRSQVFSEAYAPSSTSDGRQTSVPARPGRMAGSDRGNIYFILHQEESSQTFDPHPHPHPHPHLRPHPPSHTWNVGDRFALDMALSTAEPRVVSSAQVRESSQGHGGSMFFEPPVGLDARPESWGMPPRRSLSDVSDRSDLLHRQWPTVASRDDHETANFRTRLAASSRPSRSSNHSPVSWRASPLRRESPSKASRHASPESIKDDMGAANQVRRNRDRNLFKSKQHRKILRALIYSPTYDNKNHLDEHALSSIFSAINEIFFNSQLKKRVKWNWTDENSHPDFEDRIVGRTYLKKSTASPTSFETSITLSTPILKNDRYSRHLLISAFIHELIHCYLFTCCGFAALDSGGHTAGFREIARIIDDWAGPNTLHLSEIEADLEQFLDRRFSSSVSSSIRRDDRPVEHSFCIPPYTDGEWEAEHPELLAPLHQPQPQPQPLRDRHDHHHQQQGLLHRRWNGIRFEAVPEAPRPLVDHDTSTGMARSQSDQGYYGARAGPFSGDF